MFNLKSIFTYRSEEVKIMASNRFLDSINRIDEIREKKEDLKNSISGKPDIKKEDLPPFQELKVKATDSFLDSMGYIFQHHLHNF
jgi:hypothetical protein